MMKQLIWMITVGFMATLGNVSVAQAEGLYVEKIKSIHEIESILELIANIDATKHSDKAQLNAEKQQLKHMAITKLKSI